MLTTDLDKPGCSRTALTTDKQDGSPADDHGRRWTGLDDPLLRQLDAACAGRRAAAPVSLPAGSRAAYNTTPIITAGKMPELMAGRGETGRQ